MHSVVEIRWFSCWLRLTCVAVGGWLLAPQILAGEAKEASSADRAAMPPIHKLRVEGTGVSQELQAKGARLIADYGSYQLLEAPHDAAKEYVRHAKVSLRDEENVIELHARKLNTAQAEVQAQRKSVADFKGKKLHLVHFAGPVKAEWHAELKAHGVEIVSYVPHNAYLVYGDASALKKLQGHAKTAQHVQWDGEYLDDYKIHPDARPVDQKGKPRQPPDNLFAIQMVADEAANAETLQLLDGLKLEPMKKKERVLHYQNVIVRLPPDKLGEVAARPDVVSIQPHVVPELFDERQDQIVAGNLSGTSPSGPGYLAWLASKGFTQEQFDQSAFAVNVSDSGIDNGTGQPGHFGLYPLGNTGLASRVVYDRHEGRERPYSIVQGCDGHGTINAHIIAGYNDRAGFPFTDAEGYSYGLGVCPFVRVGSSVIFDPVYYTYPNHADLTARAYRDGARVSANSWGAEVFGSYTIESQMYDALVRDARCMDGAEPLEGNQEMVIVFAAGNAGPYEGSIGSPATGKNVITVGAAENVHSHSSTNGGVSLYGYDGCGLSDGWADKADDLAFFSSRGPCRDLRTKPDIVAPGTHITGGVAQDIAPGPFGTALDCFLSYGVCALPGPVEIGSSNRFFPLGQQFYTTSSGTSHSCPAVAGAAALVRQYFINRGWTPLSPAMTKAWLMNSARYLGGEGAGDSLPSANQGTGEMNLGMAFDGRLRVIRDQLAEDKFTASGQMRVVSGVVSETNEPLRVTLAWTDAPGSTIGAAYNNDLDLTITVGGQTYKGNVFNGAFSIPGGRGDPYNNVESVFIPAGVAGELMVTVTAININSDGVPNDADPIDQDFALVICNAQPIQRPLIAAASCSLLSESCLPGNGVADPGELVTVDFTLVNLGNAGVSNVVATLWTAGGVTSPSNPQNYGPLPAGGPAVTRPFSFTANGPCGGEVVATLELTDSTTNLGVVTFRFPLGSKTYPNTISFAKPDLIFIPESGTRGNAYPYPSELEVNGFPGVVGKVTVTLSNLNHSYASDLRILLVGPQGQKVELMAGAGSAYGLTNATLTFDDEASPFPLGSAITSGAYRPTQEWMNMRLNPPAPQPPYGAALLAFNHTDPNGPWQLWVFDNEPYDSGILRGGWSLALTTIEPSCCLNLAFADLGVSLTASRPTAWLDESILYNMVVTNHGPALAPAVRLVDMLPLGIVFDSATTSQGTCLQTNGTVACDLGDLPAHGSASLSIRGISVSGDILTNTVRVTSGASDPNLSNNSTLILTPVEWPRLTSSSATVVEGNNGTTGLAFTVSLVPATMRTVTVHFATEDGTATAGSDYVATNGVLVFNPQQANQDIVVTVLGDLLNEGDETFFLSLSGATNAAADEAVVATIMDDDPLPTLSISDASVIEGNAGTPVAILTVSLSSPSGKSVSALYSTADGSARAGSDYLAITRGTLHLSPGRTSTNVTVLIRGDTRPELNETFFVNLAEVVNATIADGQAVGTIVTDDAAPKIVTDSPSLSSESFVPTNGMIDPGERVTLQVALRNIGVVNTTNLVVRLLEQEGVTAPTGSQNYGALAAGGAPVSRAFSFTAAGSNFGAVTATLALQDGAVDLGTLRLTLPLGAPREWGIIALTASNALAIEHSQVTGDDRGGIAVSFNYVFVTGDDGTGRFSAGDLCGGTNLGVRYDGLTANLRSETVYSLGNGDTPIALNAGTVTSLLEVDPETGGLSGNRITLSAPIVLGWQAGLFAGLDRVVMHNGTRVYDISLPWGIVADLGAMPPPPHMGSDLGDMTYWGVAEFHENALHLVCRDSGSFLRVRVPNGPTNTVSSPEMVPPSGPQGRMAAFTVSLPRQRWYFHHPYDSIFRQGGDETVGYADAILGLPTTNPPVVVVHPPILTVLVWKTACFQALVSEVWPRTFQWRKDGTALPGATNSTLVIERVQTNHGGSYSLVVTYAFGSCVSSNAVLNVFEPDPNLVDDFEPDIDQSQWWEFGGTVQANDYGGSVSGTNSLWFGAAAQRFAATRPLDTSLGGRIQFYLRFGNSWPPWEHLDLPWDGVQLQCSTNLGQNWRVLETYDSPQYYNWTSESLVLPPEACSPATLFRWIQLGQDFSEFLDHWALDDVRIDVGPQPPVIVLQPKSMTVFPGETAAFSVEVMGTPPFAYQWRKEGVDIAGATNPSYAIANVQTNDDGNYRVWVGNAQGTALSSNGLLTVSIDTVNTNADVAVFDDPRFVDTQGGSTAESDTVQASLNSLGVAVGTFLDLNLATVAYRRLLIPCLEPGDLTTNLTTGTRAALSNFVAQGGTLIVHGDFWGRSARLLNTVLGYDLAIYDENSSDFRLTEQASATRFAKGPGTILNNRITFPIQASSLPPEASSIYQSGDFSAVVLLPVGTGNIVYLAWNWYDARPLGEQDGGWLEVLANAVGDAVPPVAPSIVQHPYSVTMPKGSTAVFSVLATGTRPLSYQWRKGRLDLAGATNSSLVLPSVQTNDTGHYCVLATNAYGAALSSNALLLVPEVWTNIVALFDDFEPGVDDAQWSAVTNTVGATNRSGSISGVNAFWFTGRGARFAATRPVDTIAGGVIEFWFRYDEKWSCAEGPDSEEGVYLEYSVDGGATWQSLGWYADPTAYDPETGQYDIYYQWGFHSVAIPGEAQTRSTQFRWHQPIHYLDCDDPWALDDVMVVTGPRAPRIVSQPTDQMVGAGSAATFAVTASGDAPLGYQWWKDGAEIPGATNASYRIYPVQAHDSSHYSVMVGNALGAVLSSDALLTVLPTEMAVGVFADPRYVDSNEGGWDNEPQNEIASLTWLGFFAFPFGDIERAAVSHRCIVFPKLCKAVYARELSTEISEAAITALSNFVARGGTMIIHGTGGSGNPGAATRLLNAVFGYSLQETGTVWQYGVALPPFTLTTQAAGTAFAYGPTTLPINEHTSVLLAPSLPPRARSLYQNDDQCAVVLMEWGNGIIVYLGWDWYRAAPESNQNGGWLNVLASAVTQPTPVAPSPPLILSQSLPRMVGRGMIATLGVSALGTWPMTYQWRKNDVNLPSATNTCLALGNVQFGDAGNYSVVVSNAQGVVESDAMVLTIVEMPVLPEFQVLTLTTNGRRGVPMEGGSGMAASDSRLFGMDLSRAFSLALVDLSDAIVLPQSYRTMVSDLRSGKVYSLGENYMPVVPLSDGRGVVANVTHLLEHDGVSGERTGGSVQLSSPIFLRALGGELGIFAGYGRIVLHTGERVYDILLPSGLVVDRGAMTMPEVSRPLFPYYDGYWGVAESSQGQLHLVYVKDRYTIARTVVPSGVATAMATFPDLWRWNAFTVSIPLNRWYFRWLDEISYADASFLVGQPPMRFQVPQRSASGFDLLLVNADGTAVTTDQLAKIHVYGTTNLALPFSNWTQLSNPLVLTNGLLRLEGLDTTTAPQRFFRAVESP